MNSQSEDYDYLPPLVAATLNNGSFFAKLTLGIVGGLFIFFLIWAAFSEVEEVTHAAGKVIPSHHVQVINNLEGGILKETLVSEGDIVKKGQIILRLDNVSAHARYVQNQENYYHLFAAAERLKALTNDQPFEIPPELLEKAPKIAQEEREHYNVQLEKLKTDLKIASQGIEQKKQELLDQQSQLRKLQSEHQLTQEELDIKEPLAKQKLISKIDLLTLKREFAEQTGQIESLKATVPRASSALKQAEEVFQQIKIKSHDDQLSELRDIEQKLEDTKSALITEKDKVSRTDIRSPVHGIIKEVKVKTIGSVIQPGEDLIEIVPLEDRLLIEAQILPSDVAFLHPGMEARIKITAYDYSIYGGLKGKLENIGADTSVDKKEQSYFKVLLRTDKNYLERNGKKMPIIPGMQVGVDILTGKKTILSYIVKPFIKARHNALTER